MSLSRVFLPVLVFFFTVDSFSQLETPAASPLAKVEQRVGIMDVSIEYSRPGVKGRTIFGGLVPFNEVWRTGANAPTKISFSDDVRLNGHEVPAGKYSLYTIPRTDEWTIIINRKLDGGERPDEKENVVQFNVKPRAVTPKVETLTFNVADIRDNTANVQLVWENTVVSFGMEFDVDTRVMAQIESELATPFRGVAGTYYEAANYYFENGKDLKKALVWVDKSLELREDAFWVWRLKSRIQAGLKDYQGAVATARIGAKKAEEAGNAQFVKYNEDAIAEWQEMK